MRNKLITAGIIALNFLLLSVVPSFAAPLDLNPCNTSIGNNDKVRTQLCNGAQEKDQVAVIINNTITIVFVVAALLALFFLIFGGVKWILSGGDKGKVDEARKTIVAAIIGLIITFLAYFILNIVLGLFGLNLSNLTIPSLTDKAA